MASRLLSYLGEVEKSLRAQGGVAAQGWEITRMVNYHLGLARMNLRQVTREGTGTALRGGIFLQEFTLADGSSCVKSTLSWDGAPSATLNAVYAKPGTVWQDEAAAVASAWLAGPEHAPQRESAFTPDFGVESHAALA